MSVIIVTGFVLLYNVFIYSGDKDMMVFALVVVIGLMKGMSSDKLSDVFNLGDVKISFKSVPEKCEVILSAMITIAIILNSSEIRVYQSVSEYYFSSDFSNLLVGLLLHCVIGVLFYRFFILNLFKGSCCV